MTKRLGRAWIQYVKPASARPNSLKEQRERILGKKVQTTAK